MKTLLALLFLLAPAPARALECDQLSTGLGLCLPRYGTDGDQWATATINAFTLINSSGVITSTTAAYQMNWLSVARIGGLPSGPAGIRFSSSVYQDAGLYWRHLGSGSYEGGGGLGVTYGLVAGSITTGGLNGTSAGFSLGGISTYSVTTSSGIKMQTGDFSIGAGGHITFSDGTKQWTSAAASSEQVDYATAAFTGADQVITATTYPGEAIVGSTVVITAIGSSSFLRYCFAFSALESSAGLSADVLIDGVRQGTGAFGAYHDGSSANSLRSYAACIPSIGTVAAGAHSLVLQVWKTGGTLTIEKDSPVGYATVEEKR